MHNLYVRCLRISGIGLGDHEQLVRIIHQYHVQTTYNLMMELLFNNVKCEKAAKVP